MSGCTHPHYGDVTDEHSIRLWLKSKRNIKGLCLRAPMNQKPVDLKTA